MNANEDSEIYVKSVVMDLENMQQKYSNLLIKYKQSVSDYINYLNSEAQTPCSKFNANSKNIDQKCYDYIWKKAGCVTTGVVNANTSWAKSQSLNDLIYNSFLWATTADSKHREGCYGNSSQYITSTNPNYNINNENYVNIQGMAYIGKGNAGQSLANTIQECEAACSANSKCTGATFVAGKCNLRTGDSPIIPSSNNSYAIISKGKQLLMNMEDLNKQLLEVNEEITNKINSGQPIYNNLQTKNLDKSKELIQNYKELEIERNNIQLLLDEYNTLDTTENENQIKITQNYYSYLLLFILTLAIIFVLIKISTQSISSNVSSIQHGGELNINAYYILFVIIVIIIIVNFSFKNFSL